MPAGLLGRTWSPGVEQLRHRNRVNFKRPLPLHFKRERMLRLVEPIYRDELKVCKIGAEKHEQQAPIEVGKDSSGSSLSKLFLTV